MLQAPHSGCLCLASCIIQVQSTRPYPAPSLLTFLRSQELGRVSLHVDFRLLPAMLLLSTFLWGWPPATLGHRQWWAMYETGSIWETIFFEHFLALEAGQRSKAQFSRGFWSMALATDVVECWGGEHFLQSLLLLLFSTYLCLVPFLSPHFN